MSDGAANTKIKAYYDGKCPMCSAIMDRVRGSAQSDSFDLRDMHRERSLPFTKAAIEKEIHVVDRHGTVYRGSDALFKIAGQYPHLKIATRLALTSPVRALASPIYRLVAANRRFVAGASSRIFWLKVATVTAFCIGLYLSRHLWIGPRSFPPAPIFEFLPALDEFAARALFTALFGLAAAALVSSKPQKFITAFVAIILVFSALDQTRWQPWVFQYSFLLVILALFSWQSDDIAGQKRTLNVARLVVASTYVFSGLQKLNANFIEIEFPWIVEPITQAMPFTAGALRALGAFAPFVQIAFGAGLLTRRFRRTALVLAVSMHVFILAMFGPTGHDWNNVVWPWTATMAVFDIVLFAGAEFSIRDVLWNTKDRVHNVALGLFAMLPVLSFFNLWDSYLSAALYSGNLNEATIYLSDAGQRSLPPIIKTYTVHTASNTNVINIQRWAIEDLNVTPYPETRVYKSIARSLCKSMPTPSQLVLIVHEQRLFFSHPEVGYRCVDLGA